ncbi:MAG: response regulator, partial [Bacteroidetes bacterium]|nr:response regulator [Bacteroidota bacterium]
MKLSTIIIDNDRNTGEHLKELLSANYPKINVVDIINNIETAFQGLVQKNPQLVFLNAKLKDGSAFELLRRFKKRKFDFIIMSTEEIFAIDAIKYGAIDYLVKPIKKKELEACIARLK